MSSPRHVPSPPTIRIIQELFQDYNELGYQTAVAELNSALEEKCPIVVIEPKRVGDEASKWIKVGNFLHKSTVIMGLTTCATISLAPNLWYLWTLPAVTTSLSYSIYTLSWASDPACKYQVELNQGTLQKLSFPNMNVNSVVVLVYKDDYRRKVLHTTVVLCVAVSVGFRLYQMFFEKL